MQVSSDGTKRIVDNAVGLHLLPALGQRPIASVRTTEVQGFVRDLEAKGLAAGSVRNIGDVVAQVFAVAVDDRVIANSPCRKIRLPKGEGDEVVPPSVEEVAAVAEAMGKRWRAIFVTLAGSGLRIAELLALEVSDVDFLAELSASSDRGHGRGQAGLGVPRTRVRSHHPADLRAPVAR